MRSGATRSRTRRLPTSPNTWRSIRIASMRLPKLSSDSPTDPWRAADEMAAAREEFAILDARINGHRRVFLDNAATTQKPRAVIARIKHFYRHENFHAKSAAAY